MTANAYFEIVNDRITPCVDVRCENQGVNWINNYREPIIQRIETRFHELINDCELERKKIPLHERLKDDIIPVHENSLMHQAQALRFCCTMKVSALFADTGTGKTKVAVDLAISRLEAGQIKKAIVFCPVSTKKNFKDEIEKWHPDNKIEWKITGLESMGSSDRVFFEMLNWSDNQTMIIIDESHMCKTPTAKRSKRIFKCCEKVSYKLIMTGTPGEGVKDFFMQYAMLSLLIINERNWLAFEQKYLIIDDRGDVIGYKNVDYLMGLVDPYTYQISKEDCLDLPGKKNFTLTAILTKNQFDFYSSTKQELLDKLEMFDNDDLVPATLIFRYFTKLQQISCGFFKDQDDEVIELGTNKFKKLESEVNYNDGQTIFFCKYLYEVEKLIAHLGEDNCVRFTGQNLKFRDEEKDLFTRGEKRFFVATMSSGGTGLNGLQHCNRLVFWSNSFKYIERKQCIGRIDRQGQTREMEIFDVISECGMDYRIRNNLARKRSLSEEIKELLNEKTKLKNYVEDL